MNIGVVGASGYAGVELLRLLAGHPKARVTVVTSRQDRGRGLTELFPALSSLANYDELVFQDPEEPGLAGQAELFFTAAPHGTAMKMAPRLLAAGARIIDLSADFRLRDADDFGRWYETHQSPELLSEAVYGLPELYADRLPGARLVANPGCYPTSVILGLAPLLRAGWWDGGSPVIADSKSGVSGAGRGAALSSAFCEVQDSFKAYKINGHRHTPEIEQELTALAGKTVPVAFTPHLVPMNRGILSTIYLRPGREAGPEALLALYRDFYQGHPFVRVRPSGFEPATADVRGTNFCDVALHPDRRTGLVKIVSVIDNLCRGAAGQAVANFNLVCGFEENAGLTLGALRP